MEDINQVHYINKDALIPIEVGSGYLQRLQKLLLYSLENKSTEELDELKKHLENNTVPEDSWMYHYTTIQMLVINIEKQAIEKNMTVLKSVDEIIRQDD